jgi:hypothetical protein
LPGAAIPSRVDLPVVVDNNSADDDEALLVEASISAESQSQWAFHDWNISQIVSLLLVVYSLNQKWLQQYVYRYANCPPEK